MSNLRELSNRDLAAAINELAAEPRGVLIDYIEEAALRLAVVTIGGIRAERAVQDQKWGGPAHDDRHAGAEWRRLIAEHAEKGDLVAVAALGFAVTEVLDRLRHRVGQAENVLRGRFGDDR